MNIKDKIHVIRNTQVILDRDLAELYDVEIKRLNEQVKRNIERFPESFMFKLTIEEFDSIRSQNATLKRGAHRKYPPYAFTEQGVAMLSGVLKSKTAIDISIQIMNAFVSMRKFIAANSEIFHRLDKIEIKQLDHDKKFKELFNSMNKSLPEKGVFFDGQVFDAYKFVSDIIRNAKESIILIDNYVDDSVLMLLSKRRESVEAVILTKKITKELSTDLLKHNAQYPKIELREFHKSHDRFLIIDNKDIYHFGASLKDLGKKWCAFSKLDKESFNELERL